MMNFVTSDKKTLVDVSLDAKDYEQSVAAFARYTPIRGYNPAGNGDYPGEIRAMYNRAIIEVELEDWEVWIACMGFGEDNEAREGYQHDYLGNGATIGYHRNFMNYANKVPGETWIKIKTLNVRDLWRSYLATILKANQYKYPGTQVGGLYTFDITVLSKISYPELYVGNMIGTANYNMLQPGWLAELTRELFPVVRGRTVTYVCLSQQGDYGSENDEILTCLRQFDDTITSIAASPFFIGLWPLMPVNSSTVSWCIGESTRRAFKRLKTLLTALQQNMYMESFTGEKNDVDCTVVHYTDFSNSEGVYIGTTNVNHVNLDDIGYDMARPLPGLVVSDPAGSRPFDTTSLMALYDERFMILAYVETIPFLFEVWCLRVMDFTTPTNTSMMTENALDTYVATKQHIGGGFFRAAIQNLPGLAGFGGKVLKFIEKVAPVIRERGGTFIKGALGDVIKAASDKEDDDIVVNPVVESGSPPDLKTKKVTVKEEKPLEVDDLVEMREKFLKFIEESKTKS
jgi:hypothetical protein